MITSNRINLCVYVILSPNNGKAIWLLVWFQLLRCAPVHLLSHSYSDNERTIKLVNRTGFTHAGAQARERAAHKKQLAFADVEKSSTRWCQVIIVKFQIKEYTFMRYREKSKFVRVQKKDNKNQIDFLFYLQVDVTTTAAAAATYCMRAWHIFNIKKYFFYLHNFATHTNKHTKTV